MSWKSKPTSYWAIYMIILGEGDESSKEIHVELLDPLCQRSAVELDDEPSLNYLGTHHVQDVAEHGTNNKR